MRSLLFPYSRLTLAEAAAPGDRTGRARGTDRRERGLTVVSQQPHWYSFDPIHIRFTRRGEAWRDILGAWTEAGGSLSPGGTPH